MKYIILCLIFYPMISKAFGEINQFDSQTLPVISISPNNNLEFKEEKFHITNDSTSIEYVFYNKGKNDFTGTVSFPLPPIGPTGFLTEFSPQKFNFQVWVDGKKILNPLVAKAIFGERDITDDLNKLKISFINYYLHGKKESIAEAIKRGYAENRIEHEDFEDEESPMINVIYPKFQTFLNFSWDQNFPAEKITRIKVNYSPKSGSYEGFPENKISWGKYINDPFHDSFLKLNISNPSVWANGIEKIEITMTGPHTLILSLGDEVNTDLHSLKVIKENYQKSELVIAQFLSNKTLKKIIDGPANCRKNPNGLVEVSIPDKETVNVKDRAKDWYLITYKEKNCWTNKINLRPIM